MFLILPGALTKRKALGSARAARRSAHAARLRSGGHSDPHGAGAGSGEADAGDPVGEPAGGSDPLPFAELSHWLRKPEGLLWLTP